MSEAALLERSTGTLAGKYLTFMLGSETYGIDILQIQEIIGLQPITRIPRVADYVRGVINLRGKVIPVMSLGRRFGFEDREDTFLTCIIVLELSRGDETVTMGVIVDEVSEVVDIASEQIESAPDLGDDTSTQFIRGMGKIGEKVVILLDMSQVVETKALAGLELNEETV